MLVLYETSAGYSLFKVTDRKKYAATDANNIYNEMFPTANDAKEHLQLLSFQPFQDTADAVAAITACQEGRISSSLQSFLTKRIKKLMKKSSSAADYNSIAIADKALAVNIKQDILSSLHKDGDDNGHKMKVVHDDKTAEIFRGIRCYMDELLGSSSDDAGGDNSTTGLSSSDLHKMQLGLSHSLGRYKLKFSADKVDTMIIQAVGLLDELDKEINTYAMRVKEWYGWHFPELQAIASDNATYAKVVLAAGHRHKIKDVDLTPIYSNSDDSSMIEINAIKEAAEISMGTDITDQDVMNIQSLADQVISMTEYRSQLNEYLRNRMNAIAPNLTILTGELVGARLIAHAGSLINLAKQPASTVQILGAEKALFRALKTKHDTPKYGLIYHASLIGQAAPKHKGKISRVLAAKASLAIRVDALSDDTANDEIDTTVGYEGRAKVEARLRQLDGGTHLSGAVSKNGGTNLKAQKTAKYDPVVAKIGATNTAYNTASDIMHLDTTTTNGDNDDANKDSGKKKEKKAKKEKKRKKGDDDDDDDDNNNANVNGKSEATVEANESSPPAKKKKRKDDDDNDDDDKEAKSAKKAAKKAKKEKRQSQE